MSEMPNLNPEQPVFLAGWNIVQQGALPQEELDWSEVLDDQRVTSYTAYDNGFIISWEHDIWPTMKIRLKSDGWVTVWTESEAWASPEETLYHVDDDEQPSNSDMADFTPNGANLVDWWSVDGWDAAPPLHDNFLAQAIEDVASNLENWNMVEGFSTEETIFKDLHLNSDGISLFSHPISSEGSVASREISIEGGANILAAHAVFRASTITNTSSAHTGYINGQEVFEVTVSSFELDEDDETYCYVQDVTNFLATGGTLDLGAEQSDDDAETLAGVIVFWAGPEEPEE